MQGLPSREYSDIHHFPFPVPYIVSMGWYETKEQRKANRAADPAAYKAGRYRRRTGFSALIEKKTGEVIVVARNGCFGRLLELDPDLYAEYALGTRGARIN
jgi:hypothetical protein